MIKHSEFKKIVMTDMGESFIRISNCSNFSDLVGELDKISNDYESYGYRDSEETGGKNKFVGDLFEIFAESFFKILSSDNRIGISEYKPVNSDDDNGVDGFGKNINGDNCTVQVKFRIDPTSLLRERDIKQFPFQSIVNYGVDIKKSDNMFVFTNCSGLHWHTDSNVFNNKIKTITGLNISGLIDNNYGFWNDFKELLRKSVRGIGVDRLSELFEGKLVSAAIK